MVSSRKAILSSNYSIVILGQRLLDPLVVVSLLYVLCWLNGASFDHAYILLGFITFCLILPLFDGVGLYRSYRSEGLLAEVPRILSGWFIVFALLLFAGFATKVTEIFSRQVLLSWFAATPLLLLSLHLALRYGLRLLRSYGFNQRTAVIAGGDKWGRHLVEQVVASPYLGVDLVGFFEDSPEPKILEIPRLGSLDDLPEYIQRNGTSIVYIALPMQAEERILQLIELLRDTTVSIYLVPDILVFNLMQFSIQDMNGTPVFAICETPFADGALRISKRLSDIMLSALILLLAGPAMLLIALAVRFSSPGPILFRQRRYGLNGQEIVVYKFRTMTVVEDGEKIVQARQNDPRITPFGRFLRRTSLDELPQFINVLQGRMSIVGPRPHAIAHNEQYRKLIRGYMLRHKVKPGITGWAQVNGYRGETDTLEKMVRRVEYDLHYVNNWSLRLDLEIILRTVTAIFRDENAY
ncbi:undecaprenyl-phosphate glucose phosphotransferase [Anthocerotibacter panamensis]|uniref:undecaprenyl-phosphate glucose phosphotransferase n=1 Tax=Anthocerotibacter panamensis TaxID=2857077 RepID=UPI001C402FAE|nr:undecaprenyl-phosphate glucose phosphotransferase [Anthocerotibacter panamensis]